PGQVDVPLHVGVEAEEVPQVVDAEVGGVAASGADRLPALPVGADPEERAGPLEEARRGLLGDVAAVPRAAPVAGDEVEPAIVAARDLVGVVVAAGAEGLPDAAAQLGAGVGAVALEEL